MPGRAFQESVLSTSYGRDRHRDCRTHQKRRDGTEVKLTKRSEAGLKGSNTSAATPVWNLGQSVRAALCNNDPACPDAI